MIPSPAKRRRPEPERRITRAALVKKALGLVDRHGLDGVSMRRLAAAVGTTPMALYRHIPGKEALLDALVSAVFEQLEFPSVEGRAWTERARAAARSLRRLLHAHPWLVALLLRGPVLSEGVFAASEAALGILRESARDRKTVASGFRVLHSYTIGYVAMEIGRRAVDPKRYRTFEAERFPLRSQFAEFLGPFDETQFEIGLDIILRGLEADRR